jgi:hypothetical protein
MLALAGAQMGPEAAQDVGKNGRNSSMDVYLEIGKKRTFAGALEWPGWSRSGKDEAAALRALFDFRIRYARAIESARLAFEPPEELSALNVVERLEGDATTDFGAPSVAPNYDTRPVDEAELQRWQALLESVWRSFDVMAQRAEGKELRKGLRGGGRDLEGIIQHVQGAEVAYLSKLGGKLTAEEKQANSHFDYEPTRRAILKALEVGVYGGLPEAGPRGSRHWTPRYFVRRTAWHVLDHLWEIEDRIL